MGQRGAEMGAGLAACACKIGLATPEADSSQ